MEISCSVVNVLNFGASDLLELSYDDQTFLVPFTHENFPDTDLSEYIMMTPDAFDGYVK
jgi:ribosomal 30S subunit maturation factor RimM